MEKLPEEGYWLVATAGLGEKMTFDSGPARCGGIKDGVVFDIGRGGWVISFAELEHMYEVAKEVRLMENDHG